LSVRSKLPRRAGAAVLAVCAHLLALLALGWRIPNAPPPLAPDSLPPVQLQLLRPAPAAPAPSPSRAARPGRSVQSNPVRPAPAQTPSPSAPVAAQPAPQVAEAAPDCAPEDLPLLTEAEKTRCRNAIDADKARRLARGADERAARQVAEANRGPQTRRMDADKEAGYDAVAQADAHQSHEPAFVGGGIGIVGVSCKQLTFPLLSGVDTNPDIFAKKGKQEHKPKPTQHCKLVLGG
jgi:hypothetical protein